MSLKTLRLKYADDKKACKWLICISDGSEYTCSFCDQVACSATELTTEMSPEISLTVREMH